MSDFFSMDYFVLHYLVLCVVVYVFVCGSVLGVLYVFVFCCVWFFRCVCCVVLLLVIVVFVVLGVFLFVVLLGMGFTPIHSKYYILIVHICVV